MTDQEALAFWLKKRGLYPFITFRGGGMKAMVNIEIPLTEIADQYGVDKLEVGGKIWTKVEGKNESPNNS